MSFAQLLFDIWLITAILTLPLIVVAIAYDEQELTVGSLTLCMVLACTPVGNLFILFELMPSVLKAVKSARFWSIKLWSR